MDQEWQWIIGLGVTLSLGWGSILAGTLWRIVNMIRKVEEQAKTSDDALHGRINRVREDAVHKNDMDGLATRLSGDMRDMRQEQRDSTKATNDRLDALLAAIANRNGGHEK